jgi:uncharacterized protein
MKDLLKFIIVSIVDKPEKVKIIKEENPHTGFVFYSLKVDPDDMGKVIGKKGKIIKAIRDLTKVRSILHGEKAAFTLQEE